MIPFEHGLKCAELISNSDMLWLDGMGHDIPESFADEILKKLFQHLRQSTG